MRRSENNPWLNRFAVFVAAATFCLIAIGGLVTSHEAGLAVPDWPTTYGYNMFFFPFSYWIGGIFYEHSHRLFASFVGLLTVVLAAWLGLKESRRWLRRLGVLALIAVVLQGVLGGLRVTLYKDEIGIFHAMLAQLFFALVSLIALFTSPVWRRLLDRPAAISNQLRAWLAFGTALVFVQLILGATMRHQHAGLAVPDFPLAYGKIWPPMDAASIEAVNRTRIDARDFKPINAVQIGLHMSHRIGALLAWIAVAACAWKARRELGPKAPMVHLAVVWFALLVCQATLGAATVLSNKAADIATAHVVFGALSLICGAILCSVAYGTTARNLEPITSRVSSDSAFRPSTASNPV